MLKTKDGLALFTQEWEIENPKAALVLTHGFGEHSGRYAHVGKVLNDAGYSLYAYDLRGHGKSEGKRGHTPSFEHFLDDLGFVINKTKQRTPTQKVFVYGHSMGGNITLNYALRRPNGLAGVIATAPWIKRAIEGSPVQAALGKIMASIVPAFSQTVPSLDGLLTKDTSLDAVDDPLCHRTMSAKLFVEVSGAAEYLLAHANEFRLPLFLGHGSADPVIAIGGSEQFVADVPSDKTFKRYEGYLHEVHNEIGREAFFNDLIAWLDRMIEKTR
jgi:alpha-beta hydrolase superfamily lysophospholipase